MISILHNSEAYTRQVIYLLNTNATKSAIQLFFALPANPLRKPVQSLNHFSVPLHHRPQYIEKYITRSEPPLQEPWASVQMAYSQDRRA